MEHIRYFSPEVNARWIAMGKIGSLVGKVAYRLELDELFMIQLYSGILFDVLGSHANDIKFERGNTVLEEDLNRLTALKRAMCLSPVAVNLMPEIDDIVLNEVRHEFQESVS